MISSLNGLRGLSFSSMLLQLLLSMVCGAAIGLERSSRNRPAGFRTHILVCLGACIATITGLYLYVGLHLPADISRIGAQVVTGLGFIGAGTIIITKKMTIKGITTAAGLWVTGIIGLAIGFGFYEGGVIGTALVLITEVCFSTLSGKIQKNTQYVFVVLYNDKTSLDQMLRFCKDHRMAIVNLQIQSLAADREAQYSAEVTLRGDMDSAALLETVQRMPGIVSAQDL